MSTAKALRPQNSIWLQSSGCNPDQIGQHSGLADLSWADIRALAQLAEAFPSREGAAVNRSQAAKIFGIKDLKAAANRLRRLDAAGCIKEVRPGSRGRGLAGEWVIDFHQVRKMGVITLLKMGVSPHIDPSVPEKSQKMGVVTPLRTDKYNFVNSCFLSKQTEKNNTPSVRQYPEGRKPRQVDERAGMEVGVETSAEQDVEIAAQGEGLWRRILPEIEAWIGDEGAAYQTKRIREACLLSPEEAWMTFEGLRVATKGWSKRGSAVGAMLRAMGVKGEEARQESAKYWSSAVKKACQTLQKAGWVEEPADGTPLASSERQKASLNGYRRLPLGQEGLEARKCLLEASKAKGGASVKDDKAPDARPKVDPEAVALWERFLEAAGDCMGEASYQEWLKPCHPLRFSAESQTLWIGTPSEAASLWISQSLEEEVNQAREAAGLMDLNLKFEMASC